MQSWPRPLLKNSTVSGAHTRLTRSWSRATRMMGPAIRLPPFTSGLLHSGPKFLRPCFTRIGARSLPTLVGILRVIVTELLLEIVHTEIVRRWFKQTHAALDSFVSRVVKPVG